MDSTLTKISNESGVIIMPRKLPKIELKMAAVSFPSDARVKITALDTGGGILATVSILWKKNIISKALRKAKRYSEKVFLCFPRPQRCSPASYGNV